MGARHETFRIYFTLNGKDFAYRTWIGVPRVGERVMFHPKSGADTYRVLDVLWGAAVDDDMQNGPTINIAIAKIDKEPS